MTIIKQPITNYTIYKNDFLSPYYLIGLWGFMV